LTSSPVATDHVAGAPPRLLDTHAAAAAAFAALAVGLTWPLALHATTHLAGATAGDNIASLWNFWWMRHALASSHESIFYTTFLFYPFGSDLVLHTHTASTAFIGATLLSTVSIVTAQNITIIGSYALNGFAAYLLAWWLTRQRGASMAAGIFYQAAPYFAGHLYGHFNLIAGWVLPMFALLWLRALATGSAAAAVAAGLGLLVAAFTDYYYATYLGVFAACALASRWIIASIVRRPSIDGQRAVDRALAAALVLVAGLLLFTWTTGGAVWSIAGITVSMKTGFNVQTAGWVVGLVWLWRRWRPVLRLSVRRSAVVMRDLRVVSIAAIVAVAGTSPIWLGAIQLWRAGGYASQPYLWHSAPAGIDLAGFLGGNPFHPLWADALQRFFARRGIGAIDRTAWLGVAPMAFLWLTRRRWIRMETARLWLTVAAVFLIWSLGPYFTLLGFNTGLPLPEILLRYVPIVANARMPGRAIVMLYVAAAMLLALAIATSRLAQRPRLIACFCLAVIVDFAAAPFPLLALDEPEVYHALAALPPGAVLELPFGVRDGFGESGALDPRSLYYQSIHGKPIVGGFVARLSNRVKEAYDDSPLFGPLLRLSAGDRTVDETRDHGAAARLLRQYAIRYVVVNTKTASADLQRYARSTLLMSLMKQYPDGRELYALK
jgi:hypothetical protein